MKPKEPFEIREEGPSNAANKTNLFEGKTESLSYLSSSFSTFVCGIRRFSSVVFYFPIFVFFFSFAFLCGKPDLILLICDTAKKGERDKRGTLEDVGVSRLFCPLNAPLLSLLLKFVEEKKVNKYL